MVDFSPSRGEFTEWSRVEREEFLGKLTEVIVQRKMKPIWALLPLLQFKALSPEKQSAWQNDPYFVCLQDSIELATNYAAEMFDPPEVVKINYDDQQKFQAKAKQVYRACQTYLRYGDRLEGFEPDSSAICLPLQVADLVAYEALQLCRTRDDGTFNIDKPRWPMMQLMDKKFCDFEFYTVQKLWKREPLPFITGSINVSHPDRIALDVLVEEFVGVEFRAVSRQEEEADLLSMPCHPALHIGSHMGCSSTIRKTLHVACRINRRKHEQYLCSE